MGYHVENQQMLQFLRIILFNFPFFMNGYLCSLTISHLGSLPLGKLSIGKMLSGKYLTTFQGHPIERVSVAFLGVMCSGMTSI